MLPRLPFPAKWALYPCEVEFYEHGVLAFRANQGKTTKRKVFVSHLKSLLNTMALQSKSHTFHNNVMHNLKKNGTFKADETAEIFHDYLVCG